MDTNKSYQIIRVAKKYYEYHGNLEIPVKFKTINGYEFNETGINLGIWLASQRANKNLELKIKNKKIQNLLKAFKI